tara:strand:+ start:196 stop:738 length:543 start_codon:yes stop_codon:yes gene_type:complete
MSEIIDKTLDYAYTLIGTPYVLWKYNEDYDFYCDRIPSTKEIKDIGVNCASFINLLIQYAGRKIPENTFENSLRGGTDFWFKYFNSKSMLTKFDYTKKYPLGTLFLRNYRNFVDQGHLAMLSEYYEKDTSKTLYSRIIHAYCHNDTRQVGITTLGQSHFCVSSNTGYYEYVILPSKWLQI